MDVKAVADEMAGKLGNISGLNAFGYPVGSLPLPGAVVGLPDVVDYDQTYGRGSDEMSFPVWLMVGRTDDAASVAELLPYLAGSGAKSVKAALDSTTSNTYSSCDVVHVAMAVTGAYTYNGVDAFGAEFTVNVFGSGS